MKKNEAAWVKVFEKRKIKDEIDKKGFSYITAKEIKNISNREPRLMAKMDTLESRPSIFEKNNLTIFPVKNGKYIIFRDEKNKSYFGFNSSEKTTCESYNSSVNLANYDTLPKHLGFSESQAIDYAFLTSLIRTFTADNNLQLTLRGRLRSSKLSFSLPDLKHTVNVDGVQIEVDSGYESIQNVVLIEAKIGKRNNFHIRQLYYPYLEWSQRTNKNIVPIFLSYSNGIYYLNIFKFHSEFGNLSIIKSKCFTINESQKVFVSVAALNKIKPQNEPKLPFPQADDMDKIVDLISFLEDGPKKKIDISTFFEFDERQGDYYANAASYLGLVSRKNKEGFILTEKGAKFTNLKFRQPRLEFLMNCWMELPSFHEIFKIFITSNCDISKIEKKVIAAVIKKYRSDISLNTAKRRSITIMSWLRWIVDNIDFKP